MLLGSVKKGKMIIICEISSSNLLLQKRKIQLRTFLIYVKQSCKTLILSAAHSFLQGWLIVPINCWKVVDSAAEIQQNIIKDIFCFSLHFFQLFGWIWFFLEKFDMLIKFTFSSLFLPGTGGYIICLIQQNQRTVLKWKLLCLSDTFNWIIFLS